MAPARNAFWAMSVRARPSRALMSMGHDRKDTEQWLTLQLASRWPSVRHSWR